MGKLRVVFYVGILLLVMFLPSLSKAQLVVSIFLCKLSVCHFLEERQAFVHFSYRG
jgi:hypothetical protein